MYFNFVRKMMTLPFLPANEIRPMFQHLQGQEPELLTEFTEYVSLYLDQGNHLEPFGLDRL